jgi:hypothetical protein
LAAAVRAAAAGSSTIRIGSRSALLPASVAALGDKTGVVTETDGRAWAGVSLALALLVAVGG